MREPVRPPLDYEVEHELTQADLARGGLPLAPPTSGQWFLAFFLVGSILALGALAIAKCAGAF